MKTTHELARDLLALPNLPVFHLDPSFVDACDEESDYTLGTPVVGLENPREGLTDQEVADHIANGFAMEDFVTIAGDQAEEHDRQSSAEEISRLRNLLTNATNAASHLCHAIETLPASERLTEISLVAAALAQQLRDILNPPVTTEQASSVGTARG